MEIEFIEDGHIYLKNGIIVPSVSEILNFIFPKKYANIPQTILNQKAEFGSHVHKAIEEYEQGKEPNTTPFERIVFEQYLRLKNDYKIKVIEQETIVSYEYAYCGRLDMIAWVGNAKSLIDIKTTAQLDKESLAWQLGLYALAYEWMHGIKFDKFYCLWLPKNDIGRLVEIIPKTKEEIIEMLERYRKEKAQWKKLMN